MVDPNSGHGDGVLFGYRDICPSWELPDPIKFMITACDSSKPGVVAIISIVLKQDMRK